MAFNITLTMTYFAFLLGFGVIVANILKKRKIPDTFFLLILGLLLGPTVFMNPALTKYVSITLVDVSAMGAIPDFLRVWALIMIVFTGTFNLNWKVFRRLSDVSINLAFVGMVFNTIIFGVAAHLIFGINIIYTLLLGAILGGTGTGVLYAFEHTLSKSKKALTIIKVESIFNSPLTVLLPILFLDLINTEPGALIEPLKYMSQFWLMIVAGIGTGIVVGLAVSKLMRATLKEYTPLLLFSIALITYALAENIGGSGMLAVAVCGLITGNMIFPEKEEVKRFDDQLSEMLRISVFTLLGAQVMMVFDLNLFIKSFVFFLIIFFSRPIFLIPTLGKMKNRFTRSDILLMSFVAPRGLAAAAMAPIVARTISQAAGNGVGNLIVNVIFLIMLFSVLFSTMSAALISKFSHKKERSAEENAVKHETRDEPFVDVSKIPEDEKKIAGQNNQT